MHIGRGCRRCNPAAPQLAPTRAPAQDPVREAEHNIRRFKALWSRAARLAGAGLDGLAARHDAMGVLELLEAEQGSARVVTVQ